MIRFIEDRAVLVKADFNSGVWVWVRGKTGDFDLPVAEGRFYSFGLPQPIQADLYSWYQAGARLFRAGNIDWRLFERKGRELASRLAIESMQRFNVYFESAPQKPAPGTSGRQHIPWKHKSDVPVALTLPLSQGSMWEGKVTLCFGYAESGWVQMAILSTAFNNHHIISLSQAFDPFPGLFDWIVGITRSESGSLSIDEEGTNSCLTARTIDENWLELIVEADHYDGDLKMDFPARRILAVVNRRGFVEEFYRRFTDFLDHEYSQDGWCDLDSSWYSEEEIARAMQILPPSLDLEPIRRYLGLND